MTPFYRKRLNNLISGMLALLLFAAAGMAGARSVPAKDGVGMDVSGFESVTFSGEPVDGSIFADYELTVINIWQRWCGPCWIELPYFLELHEYYSSTPEADVSVWGALYYGSNPDTIQQAVEFVEENGYNWNHMLMCETLYYAAVGGEDTDMITVPQTLIVDRYGVVRAQVFGKVDSYEELDALTSYWLEALTAEYEASMGDVDGSGEVTVTDALLAMRFAMGIVELTTAQQLRADMNGSHTVDASDALLILRAAMNGD